MTAVKRRILIVMVLGWLVGCGASGPGGTGGAGGLSADDVGIGVEEVIVSNGVPAFNVTFTNNAGLDVSASASFRLLNGDVVVDTGTAFSPDRLEAGQSFTREVRFFDAGTHSAYTCYAYDLSVFSATPGNLQSDEKTYSTCP